MENKLKRLTRKKVTVTTPNDSITGKLVFNFGYLNRFEYFVDGYENETFTARDVKSIRGTKISLKKNFDAMESNLKSFKQISEQINEALSSSERRLAKSLTKEIKVYYRNMDKVEKFAFKNTRNLAKVERPLGGMIADLKRDFHDSSRFVKNIEKIVGRDRFFNFKEFSDDAYETMVSAEGAFEEHIRQLKDDDPDAQETLDIFLSELESANQSFGEFLRMAFVALEDSLDEAKYNAIKEDNFDDIEKSTDDLLRIAKTDLKKAKKSRRKNMNSAKRQFKVAKVRLANAKSKAEIKIAKQQLKAAVAAHEGGDKREIKQLKLDIKRARAERKSELQLAKQDLDQAKFDLKNAKDKEAINIAKAEIKTAKDLINLAQLKTEAFEITENMINEKF